MIPKEATIIIKIRTYLKDDERNSTTLSNATGVDVGIINSILSGKRKKYRSTTLDILYEYFGIERDDYYKENLKRWVMPVESILGSILRNRRIQMWYSIEDVANLVKWEERQLARIEAGDSLPSYQSYYISKLLPLYQFTPQEQEQIRWFICILKDMVKIHNKYDIEKKG
jgi:hypothetical protein